MKNDWIALVEAGYDLEFDLTYRSGVVVATGTELIYPLLPETMRIVAGVTGGLARDVFMAGAHSGTSLRVAFGVWLKECRRTTAVERTRWSCISPPSCPSGLARPILLQHLAADSVTRCRIARLGDRIRNSS